MSQKSLFDFTVGELWALSLLEIMFYKKVFLNSFYV